MELKRNKIRNTQYEIRNTKYAFTLVEILIVVAILGILAAIVLPTFKGHIIEAKEAAAKDTLRIVRNAIELYATKHDDVPPGYPGDDPSQSPGWIIFWAQIIRDGKYLPSLPKNPFNESEIIKVIPNADELPTEATGQFGWIYKPATRDFRIDWPGTDSKGIRFYDY
jgi:prepilin-type N-terminal cleavage/methylation domain-containing protein